jgi:hypothetical protein
MASAVPKAGMSGLFLMIQILDVEATGALRNFSAAKV